MKTSGHETEPIQEILRQAYLQKENIEVDGRWQRSLMARISEIGPLEPEPRFLTVFQELVWRLAPVTCPLTLGLTGLLIKLDLSLGYDTLQLLNGLEESMVTQLFGA